MKNLTILILLASAVLAVPGCHQKQSYIDSLGIKMLSVPAGSLMMGDSSGQWDEKPVHKVFISKPFSISETEITAKQFRKFKKDDRLKNEKQAIGISWYEANAFCQWLSEKEGKHYRLPTEAEWEYVCRNRNSLDVQNMLDTVQEWCYDWYGAYPHTVLIDPSGMDTGMVKVVRGGLPDIFGKKYSYPEKFYFRPANRSGLAPAFRGFILPAGTLKRVVSEREQDTALLPGLYGIVYDDLAMKKPLALYPLPSLSSTSVKWPSLNNWTSKWQGFIEIPEPGTFAFTVKADNRISVSINEKSIIKGNGNAGPLSGTIHLEAGIYPLTIRYLHDGGESFLTLCWRWKSHPEEVIPASAFYHTGKEETIMNKEYKKGIFARYVKPSIGFRIVQAPESGGGFLAYKAPFVQQCLRQTPARVTHLSDKPYFRKRFLHPVPPDSCTKEEIIAAGLHPALGGHNHHSSLVVCPNGDLLAVYYSSVYEDAPEVLLMGCRLRYGSDEWDMPTPILDFPDVNDVSPLLWREGNKIYLFWGNIHLKGGFPFQWVESTDNGATFSKVHFPVITKVVDGYTSQPITSVFRDKQGAIYLACDGIGAHSLLWTSNDNMKTWFDTGGRTKGRHTAVVPLKDGTFFGVGGKESDIDGYMPLSISKDKGKLWQIKKSIFPSLGDGQRPALIRLKSGHLLYAGDFQRGDGFQPAGFHQRGAFVALSGDEGKTWIIKKLPGTLPCTREETAKKMKGGTLGYVSLAQSENGMIHLITSKNQPALHFEFNESWILDTTRKTGSDIMKAKVAKITAKRSFTEHYPDGRIRDKWHGGTTLDGRFLLDGKEEWFYDDGTQQYEVNYMLGQKTGTEKYFSSNGKILWERIFTRPGTFTWIQYWNNGQKKSETHWSHFHCDGVAYRFNRSGKLISQVIFDKGHMLKSKKQS